MPKFGELLPANVWAASTRTLSAIARSILTQPLFATSYPGANAVTAGVADAFGSWVSVMADVGAGVRLYAVVVDFRFSSSSGRIEVEFGEGASPSSILARVGARKSSSETATQVFVLDRPLTDNVQLSTRARDNGSGASQIPIYALIG